MRNPLLGEARDIFCRVPFNCLKNAVSRALAGIALASPMRERACDQAFCANSPFPSNTKAPDA